MSYLPTYLPTYLLTIYLLNHNYLLSTYIPTYTYLLTYLLFTYILSHILHSRYVNLKTYVGRHVYLPIYLVRYLVATPLWGKCEDETHTPKSGNLESSGTVATLELNRRRKNTSPWGVLYTIGKALKSRCRKWPCMSHLDICNTSYGQKKGRESNWQFDSRPQKVGNRPNPGVWRWSATHRWKDFGEKYKFSSDLISIRGLS